MYIFCNRNEPVGEKVQGTTIDDFSYVKNIKVVIIEPSVEAVCVFYSKSSITKPYVEIYT